MLKRIAMSAAALALTGWAGCMPGSAADLPKSTQNMLSELKLKPEILTGIDDELKVPDPMLAAAKKEGVVNIYTTMPPRVWEKVHSIWQERYPDIKLNHSEVRTAARRYIRPLAAFKEGRSVVDLIMGLSGNIFLFRQLKAFENLSDVPNYSKLPDTVKQVDHITVATRARYWCMAYNTQRVKAGELPKTWDDLVNGTRFGDKKLLIGNRPNNWLLNLWEAKGDAWAKEFTGKLMTGLKPQLRKEGLSAVLNLVVLGEGDAVIPAAMNRVGPLAGKGAPIAFHCPEPVPFTTSEMGLMSNSPNKNAAKLFVNWFLSKEGQVAQYWGDQSIPIHTGLQRKEFVFFPEAVANKGMALLGDNPDEASKRLIEFWDPLWQQGGGG